MMTSRAAASLAVIAGALYSVHAVAATCPTTSNQSVSLNSTDTLCISDSTTHPGTSNVTAGTNVTNALVDSPGSYLFGHGFTTNQTSQFVTTTPSSSYGFYDDYIIQIGTNQVDTLTSTISLGKTSNISGLAVRLYNYTANGSVAPLLTPPAANSVIDSWQAPAGPNGTVAWTPTQNLTAGTYVLEVRGTATGTAGGTYSGEIDLSPVPLPAGLPLLLSGLAAFALLLRRRTA